MNMPTISVVIPLYNNEATIVEAIQSVLKQTFAAKEIIVVNDGSTDGAEGMLKAANLPKVRVLNRKHQGTSASRNIGIKHAKCEFVAFLDPADQWMPSHLEEMVKLTEKFPQAGLFGSRYQVIQENGNFGDANISLKHIDPDGMLITDYFNLVSRGDLPFVMSSVVVNRNLFKHIGGFRAGEAIGADQDFFARVALKAGIAYSPNIRVLHFNQSDLISEDQLIPEKECPFSQRLNLIVANQKIKAGLKRDIQRYCASHLCTIAKLNAQIGRYTIAAKILQDPRCKLNPKQYLKAKLITYVSGILAFAGMGKAA